jgi:hypothetical protein
MGMRVKVLDLDETLVHSTLESEDRADFTFPVSFNNREHTVSVRARPHLKPFLERCAALFEVVVFTASQKIYAEQLLNILDPQRWGSLPLSSPSLPFLSLSPSPPLSLSLSLSVCVCVCVRERVCLCVYVCVIQRPGAYYQCA